MSSSRLFVPVAAFAVLTIGLCSSRLPAFSQTPDCNNAGFLATEHAHANRAEVTLCGTVGRVRQPRRTRSGVHRLFYVIVPGVRPVEIDANVEVMGDFPIRPGESVVVRGEYYYDENGREGVHWTHHTDRGSHPPGYLILDGTKYD